MQAIEEEESQWHNEENILEGPVRSHKNGDLMGDMIFDVWELGSENIKDWFHHWERVKKGSQFAMWVFMFFKIPINNI